MLTSSFFRNEAIINFLVTTPKPIFWKSLASGDYVNVMLLMQVYSCHYDQQYMYNFELKVFSTRLHLTAFLSNNFLL